LIVVVEFGFVALEVAVVGQTTLRGN
jgi:hypothetical protein